MLLCQWWVPSHLCICTAAHTVLHGIVVADAISCIGIGLLSTDPPAAALSVCQCIYRQAEMHMAAHICGYTYLRPQLTYVGLWT